MFTRKLPNRLPYFMLLGTLLEATKLFEAYFDFRIDFKSAELEFWNSYSCIRLSSRRGRNRTVGVSLHTVASS